MASSDNSPERSEPTAEALLAQMATNLRGLVADLASRLRPFPAFLNMVSVQAMELEPAPDSPADRGCVVVLPDGEICELDLMALPGIEGIRDIDSVEEIRELELLPEEYIGYAASAIRLLYQELRRRGN